MSQIDREILLQTLRGYAEVNRITEAERRARLRTLTDQQAREIINDLYRDSNTILERDDPDPLAHYRLQHHLKVREAMVKLARDAGYEPSL